MKKEQMHVWCDPRGVPQVCISNGKVRSDQEKVSAISEQAIPESIKHVQ